MEQRREKPIVDEVDLPKASPGRIYSDRSGMYNLDTGEKLLPHQIARLPFDYASTLRELSPKNQIMGVDINNTLDDETIDKWVGLFLDMPNGTGKVIVIDSLSHPIEDQ